MTIQLHQGGTFGGAHSVSEVLRAVVQTQARALLGDVSAAAITDNSGGDASRHVKLPKPVVGVATNGANTAADASDLTTELEKVYNALSSVLALTNPVRVKLGLPQALDNSGGTASTTIPAIDTTLDGAATGLSAEDWNRLVKSTNAFVATVAAQVNSLNAAVGADTSRLTIEGLGDNEEIIAPRNLPTDADAVSVGIVPVATVNAGLKAWADGLASIADALNVFGETPSVPKVVAV